MLRRALVLLTAVVLAASCAVSEPDVRANDAGGATVERVEDPDCDAATIGGEEATLVAALSISDGVVEGLCAGEPDARLDAAWSELIDIVPLDRLDAVGVFGAFDDADSDVLAFVAMLGDANERFGIVVNVAAIDLDPDEFRLTLAHEVSHVFTQTPDQLDVTVDEADCSTLYNGNGCFLDGALVMEWIDQFWSEQQLASIPDLAEGDEDGADRRCELDAGFPGPYSATSPEEDLAESFSAYVFDLEVPAAVAPRVDFFAVRSEFDAIRDHALSSAQASPVSSADLCGP